MLIHEVTIVVFFSPTRMWLATGDMSRVSRAGSKYGSSYRSTSIPQHIKTLKQRPEAHTGFHL